MLLAEAPLVAKCGAAGRCEAIECVLLALAKGEAPGWALNESIRVGRSFLRATGRDTAEMRDGDGWRYTIRRER